MQSNAVQVALLLACGAGAGPLAAQPCGPGICKVIVSVVSCEEGTLTASPDPITMPEANNIEWTLSTAGFRFVAQSIAINGIGFRDNPGVNGNGMKFTVHNDRTDRRIIKYAIQVLRVQDNQLCNAWDPFINNQ